MMKTLWMKIITLFKGKPIDTPIVNEGLCLKDIKLLMEYTELHKIDKLTYSGVIIEKSYHEIPDQQTNKPSSKQDLIGWSAD